MVACAVRGQSGSCVRLTGAGLGIKEWGNLHLTMLINFQQPGRKQGKTKLDIRELACECVPANDQPECFQRIRYVYAEISVRAYQETSGRNSRDQ